MSLKSGFQSTVIPFVIGATNSGAVYSNGGLSIGTLKAGRYLAILCTALDPLNVGANITSTTMICTGVAVFGGAGAVGLAQLSVSAANAADINSRHSCSNIIDLAVDTPIFITISAGTSAGQWQSSTSLQDSLCNRVSFIKLQ